MEFFTFTLLKAQHPYAFNFYGDAVQFSLNQSSIIRFTDMTNKNIAITKFYTEISSMDYSSIFKALNKYKKTYKPDDWLYYQLVRKIAQRISPKEDNYWQYTLYKWYFMLKSGYTPLLAVHNNMILFYIESNENVYNVPLRKKDGKQFVCLNYHDYGNNIDFTKNKFTEVPLPIMQGSLFFSYKISKLPNFDKSDYVQKDLTFSLNDNEYHFKIKVNRQIKTIFANYPTVDYENYLNTPLSNDTYSSLIPALKKFLKGKNEKQGVDYLMQLTRYAFIFEPDTKQFGQEKRLTPEQTLLYENCDCEDRVIFFFSLVKEIYNLPMIVIAYPQHVTVAVSFNKRSGKPIMYEGKPYYVCEPTPQTEDLNIGQESAKLKNEKYAIVYSYVPK